MLYSTWLVPRPQKTYQTVYRTAILVDVVGKLSDFIRKISKVLPKFQWKLGLFTNRINVYQSASLVPTVEKTILKPDAIYRDSKLSTAKKQQYYSSFGYTILPISPFPGNVFPHDHAVKKTWVWIRKESRHDFEKRPEGFRADKQSPSLT